MTLKKVKSGDALVIPAQTFNTFIAAARDFRARQQAECGQKQEQLAWFMKKGTAVLAK